MWGTELLYANTQVAPPMLHVGFIRKFLLQVTCRRQTSNMQVSPNCLQNHNTSFSSLAIQCKMLSPVTALDLQKLSISKLLDK
jgi:hypothetical protein